MLTMMKTFTLCYIKKIPIQEDKTSTEKDECHYLYKKDDDLKSESIQMKTTVFVNMVMTLKM